MENIEIHQLKLKLIEWIIRQENSDGLQVINNQVNILDKRKEDSNKIVGYRSNGLRVQKEQLVTSLQEALRQNELGQITSIDDLEKLSEQW